MSKPKTPDHQKSVLKGDTYVDPFTGLQEKSTGPTTDPFTGEVMGRPTGVGLPPKMSIPVYMRGDRESYHKYGVAVLPQVDMEERRAQQQSNWEKWNHGSIEKAVPPLRLVRPDDFKFLNGKEKSEKQVRASGGGKYRKNRRRN